MYAVLNIHKTFCVLEIYTRSRVSSLIEADTQAYILGKEKLKLLTNDKLAGYEAVIGALNVEVKPKTVVFLIPSHVPAVYSSGPKCTRSVHENGIMISSKILPITVVSAGPDRSFCSLLLAVTGVDMGVFRDIFITASLSSSYAAEKSIDCKCRLKQLLLPGFIFSDNVWQSCFEGLASRID